MASVKPLTLPDSTVYSKTILRKVLFTYEWKVENFTDFYDRQYEIPSPKFIPNPTDGSTWRLLLFKEHIYPLGPHLSIRLIKLSSDNEPHLVKYTISIATENSRNVEKITHAREKVFRLDMDSDVCTIIDHGELDRRKLLQHPNLTIRCEMDMLLLEESNEDEIVTSHLSESCCSKINNLSSPNSYVKLQLPNFKYDVGKGIIEKKNNLYHSSNLDSISTSTIVPPEKKESLSALSDDFLMLYMNKKFADITIDVEGKSMTAHKAVLAARSDILKTSNEVDGKVSITGIRSTLMEAVLYFVYTGKMRQLTSDHALDLLRAAKRFRIESLQKETEDFLKTNIKLENALDLLELADELDLDGLKHTCLKFVSHNHFDLMKFERWQTVLTKNPRVAGQVLLAVASVQELNIS